MAIDELEFFRRFKIGVGVLYDSGMCPTRSGGRTELGELSDLTAFCLVVDLGSLTAAAAVLRQTKGAVSRRLSRLEQRVAVPLLKRSPRSVRPTEEGRAFRERLGPALALLEEAHALAHRSGQAARGLVRLTATADIATRILAPIMVRFAAKFPQVGIDFFLTEEVMDMDVKRIDLAFRVQTSARDSQLVARKLLDMRVSGYASPAYLRGRNRPQSMADLGEHRLLAFRVLPSRFAEAGPGLAALSEKAALRANDAAFLREAALAGGGIAFLPRLFVDEDVLEGRLVPLLEDLPFPSPALYLLHAPKRQLPTRVRVLIDFVADALSGVDRQIQGLPRE